MQQQDSITSSFTHVLSPVTLMTCLAVIFSAVKITPYLCSKYIPYTYQQISHNKVATWNSLPSSTLHAITVCILSCMAILTGSVDIILTQSDSRLGFITIQFSLGYFIGDFIICLLHPSLRNDRVILLHHSLSILCAFLGLYYEGRWMSLILIRLLEEFSTPFVNLFWIITELKVPKHSLLFTMTALGLTLSFFLSRIASLPFMWYHHYRLLNQELLSPTYALPLVVIVTVIGVTMVLDSFNIYWFSKICKGFLKWMKSKNNVKK